MAVLLLVLGLVSIYLAFIYMKDGNIKALAKKLPGPPALPFLGNGLQIKKAANILDYFIASHEKYGHVSRHWLGLGKPVLYTVLSDPKDVEILLRDTRNLKKSDNYNFIKPWLGEGLITSAGSHWQTHRKVITPAFFFNILEKFVEVFNEKGKILIRKLEEKVGKGEFDIVPYINLYALDAILESAMGAKSQIQEHEDSTYVRAIHEMTEIATFRSFHFFHRCNLTFPFTKLGRLQSTVLKTLHGFCENVISKRKQELGTGAEEIDEPDDSGKKKRLAFLDLLLVGQKNGSGFSDRDIREEVDTFLFAGHDTTTTAIAFALYHLSQNQEVQDKVYEEIQSILEDSQENLALKDLQNFRYLDQVVKEALRVSPPVPFVSRRLEFDLQINNYTLPAGSAAAIFIYMLHRNPEVFPDPDKFDPGRFSEESSRGRHPYAYVPFSAGSRNCIGQKYAQLEIKSTIIKVVRKFKVLPGQPVEKVKNEVVLKSSNGIRVKLERRQIKN